MNVNKVKPNGLALLPIIVFLILFIGIGVVQKDFYSMPAVIGFFDCTCSRFFYRLEASALMKKYPS